MPVITFQGLPSKAIENYYEDQLDNLSHLIGANKEYIFFVIDEKTKILNLSSSAYIRVEWVARRDKEELLVNHLKKYFANYTNNLLVLFTEINGKLFINQQRIG